MGFIAIMTFLALAGVVLFFTVPRNFRLWPTIVTPVVLILFTIAAGVVVVPAGEVYVAHLFGTVKGQPITNGLHVLNPLNSYHHYDVKRLFVEMSAGSDDEGSSAPAVASDGIRLERIDATIPYRVNPDYAGQLFERVRPYEPMLVASARSALRDAVSEFPGIAAATTARQQLAARVTQRFEEKLAAELALNGFSDADASQAFLIGPAQIRRMELPARILAANAELQASEIDLERQSVLTQIAEQEAVRRGNEGQGVQNLIDSIGLTGSPSPDEIATVLNAMADKTRADAMVRAVEDGNVQLMIMGGATPAVSTR